ncbi:MAG TPA: transporter substrate-binding domain-containing protein, partial [Bacteroidales bacterium]|nr:transporter substrate-binding domain-containing protein [Bacteroidales bacterium]
KMLVSVPVTVSRDLDKIVASGKITAVTNLNQTDYFVFSGEPMGFSFEMLRRFANHIGVTLEIIPENDIDKAFDMMQSGSADIMAMSLTVNSGRKEMMAFTDPLFETRQVLVQRKPEGWRTMTLDAIDKKLLRSQHSLAGKSVHVQKGSSYRQSLTVLGQESGEKINVIDVPYDSEELVKQVARGEIEMTVCDEYICGLMSKLYPDLDFKTPVSFPQKVSWGMRKTGSENLLKEFNTWLASYTATNEYAYLESKYFRGNRIARLLSPTFSHPFSPYDDLIRQYSDTIGWDWKLLASLIYQESRFDPKVRSRSGAYGLMQVLPATGRHFGLDVTKSVDNNIRAGIKYIRYLDNIFAGKIPDNEERVKFILAAYNAGQGHVLDAMALAGKNGFDPQKWDNNVALFLAKKSEPEVYSDPDVKFGSLRGEAVNNYVEAILDRYGHYKNMK